MESNHIENTGAYSKENAMFNLYKLGSSAAAILSVLIGIVLFQYQMNGSRYFSSTSATTVSLILLSINVGFALTPVFLFKKGVSFSEDHFASVKYHFALPSAVAIVCSIALLTSSSSTLVLATALLALPSSAYTACIAIGKHKSLTAILGYFHIAFLVAILSMLYTDFSIELNAPMKLFIQFTGMAAILSALADIRIVIGKESVGFYTFSKIAMMVLSFFTTIGVFFEVIPNYESYGIAYVIFPLYFLSLTIPSTIRFFCSTLRAHASNTANNA